MYPFIIGGMLSPYVGSCIWTRGYYTALKWKLQSWRPNKINSKRNEESYTDELYSYLKNRGYVIHNQYKEKDGRKIDFVIEVNPNSWIKTGYRLNVEAKLNLNRNSEYDRLVGQVEHYRKNFDGYTVILLLGKTKEKYLIQLKTKYNVKNVDIIECKF